MKSFPKPLSAKEELELFGVSGRQYMEIEEGYLAYYPKEIVDKLGISSCLLRAWENEQKRMSFCFWIINNQIDWSTSFSDNIPSCFQFMNV